MFIVQACLDESRNKHLLEKTAGLNYEMFDETEKMVAGKPEKPLTN